MKAFILNIVSNDVTKTLNMNTLDYWNVITIASLKISHVNEMYNSVKKQRSTLRRICISTSSDHRRENLRIFKLCFNTKQNDYWPQKQLFWNVLNLAGHDISFFLCTFFTFQILKIRGLLIRNSENVRLFDPKFLKNMNIFNSFFPKIGKNS